MMSTKIIIKGYGKDIPKKTITNHDFIEQGLDTTDEWITSRTGIKKRHVIDENTNTSNLAINAAKQALETARLNANDLDLIIVATSTPDYDGFPSVACQVQHGLEANQIPAFDISAACTGFNYALTVASQFIQNNSAKHVLVIGVDALSKIVDWKDRSTCILFGDGAGAVILQVSDQH